MEGRGSKQAGAEHDAAVPVAESAESTTHAEEVKHEAEHGQQHRNQQQQKLFNSSPCAVGSDTSPDKHIGQLFFCHLLVTCLLILASVHDICSDISQLCQL